MKHIMLVTMLLVGSILPTVSSATNYGFSYDKSDVDRCRAKYNNSNQYWGCIGGSAKHTTSTVVHNGSSKVGGISITLIIFGGLLVWSYVVSVTPAPTYIHKEVKSKAQRVIDGEMCGYKEEVKPHTHQTQVMPKITFNQYGKPGKFANEDLVIKFRDSVWDKFKHKGVSPRNMSVDVVGDVITVIGNFSGGNNYSASYEAVSNTKLVKLSKLDVLFKC